MNRCLRKPCAKFKPMPLNAPSLHPQSLSLWSLNLQSLSLRSATPRSGPTGPRWRATGVQGLQRLRGLAAATAWLAAALLAAPALHAAPGDDTVLQAREALRKKDRSALAAARLATAQQQHPLAMWVDYWQLGHRLAEVQQPELDAFYARWPGTYVEDRLRNDWLLELGKRRDWGQLLREFPRSR